MKNILSVIGSAIISLFAPSCSKTQKVIVTEQPATEPKVAFSVSDTSTVVFSKGNLQYNVIEHKWRFAPTQYDVCHENNDYVGDNYSKWTGHSGWTDLFGVGTWLEGGNPVNTSVENDEYNLDKTKAPAIGKEWRQLDPREWKYLIFNRSGVSFSNAIVHNVNGLVLLPDNWNGSYVFTNANDKEAAFIPIGDSDWDVLESEGAVFLPAAGQRYGSNKVEDVGVWGEYWTWSFALVFQVPDPAVGVIPFVYWRFYGRSVRLVK